MNDWISVEDRLPKDCEIVIAFVDGQVREVTYLDGGFVRACYWYGTVKYWMPLPEPPNEETYGKRENLLRWSEQGLYPDGFGNTRVGYTCPYCQQYVPYAGKYCGKCGERVAGGDEIH